MASELRAEAVAGAAAPALVSHVHGKSRVRLARVWHAAGGRDTVVEWQVQVLLESDMAHAYLRGSNADMTATDTVKNGVYYVAKGLTQQCSAEVFAARVAEHFVERYPKARPTAVPPTARSHRYLTRAGVCCGRDGRTEAVGANDGRGRGVARARCAARRPSFPPLLARARSLTRSSRVAGFVLRAPATRIATAVARRGTTTRVGGGVRDLTVLKTTQSGYEGFLRDSLTTLPETSERMLATSIAASWVYTQPPADCDAAFAAVQAALCGAFFGPARGGVYSPSVQMTLYQMCGAALAAVPSVESITLTCPNIHFLPVLPAGIPFAHDVYVATSEPHGTIKATVGRSMGVQPLARL